MWKLIPKDKIAFGILAMNCAFIFLFFYGGKIDNVEFKQYSIIGSLISFISLILFLSINNTFYQCISFSFGISLIYLTFSVLIQEVAFLGLRKGVLFFTIEHLKLIVYKEFMILFTIVFSFSITKICLFLLKKSRQWNDHVSP
jgi:hypothetical protein